MISFVLYLIVPMHLPNYVYGRKEIALLDKNFDSGHVRLCRVQCVNAIICLCIGYSLDLTYFILCLHSLHVGTSAARNVLACE